jgi:hypothetical protein
LTPMDPTLCWKMASVDAARALRVIESMPRIAQEPGLFIFLALGCKARNGEASRQALEKGLRGLDRLMKEEPARFRSFAGLLLPIVERIDPDLVPEVFWRDVASRLPYGNPWSTRPHDDEAGLALHLAWYDAELAAAVLEPLRARTDDTDDADLSRWGNEFRAWATYDPRGAVARLEKVAVSSDPAYAPNAARLGVAAFLALPHDERWRRLWHHWDVIFGGTALGF